MTTGIFFADEKVKASYEKLKQGYDDEKPFSIGLVSKTL